MKTMFLSLALAAAAAAAHAQTGHESHAGHEAQAAAAAAEMSDGEIRKVDRGAGRLTIRHGELKNLGMPGMTMAFRAADPAMLEQVQPGDRVRFVADKVAGVYTVVRLEAAD